MSEIPNYPAVKKEDPVARSLAKPDACAKPATLKPAGNKGVRVRPMSDKVRIRKKRDRRDVQFY